MWKAAASSLRTPNGRCVPVQTVILSPSHSATAEIAVTDHGHARYRRGFRRVDGGKGRPVRRRTNDPAIQHAGTFPIGCVFMTTGHNISTIDLRKRFTDDPALVGGRHRGGIA